QRLHRRLRHGLAPTRELRGADLVEDLAPDTVVARRGSRFVGSRAGSLALLCHAPIEVVQVDRSAARACQLTREVDRKAERVVEEEGIGATHVALLEQVAEHLDAALQGAPQRLL